MNEDDIRPEGLNNIVLGLHKKDVSDLLKFRKSFVLTNCPACNFSRYKKLFTKNNFVFVRCLNCETIFLNPRPTVKMLLSYYSSGRSNKFWNGKIFPASETSRRINIFRPRAKMIASLCKTLKMNAGVLADVGAGFGTFCEEIKKFNIFKDIVAVEPGHDLAETIRGKGFVVYEKPIEHVKGLKADIITNFELIEHLFRPDDFIRVCNKSLIKGGYIIMTTPNALGFDMSLLGKKSDHISGPDHLNLFNPKSITLLLEKNGFEVKLIKTPGKLDAEIVRNKILKGELDISSNVFIRQVLIDRWGDLGKKFQKFISSNNLSSHMLIVARRLT